MSSAHGDSSDGSRDSGDGRSQGERRRRRKEGRQPSSSDRKSSSQEYVPFTAPISNTNAPDIKTYKQLVHFISAHQVVKNVLVQTNPPTHLVHICYGLYHLTELLPYFLSFPLP